MAGKRSAGLLLFRGRGEDVEVLLGHMGGPFWAKKDAAAWSLPKGELDPDEPPEKAARREFEEELGLPAPDGDYAELGEVSSRAARSSRPGRSKPTSIRRPSCPGRSAWSGRRARGSSRSSPSWTGWSGSAWTPPARNCSRASCRSSTG